jgi:Sigma-70 region 2
MRKHVCRNSAQLAVTQTASDDLDLVHASKSGDVAAFEELVKRYDRKLLRIAQHLTHNREDAEDVVQELLESLSTLGPIPGEFKILDLAYPHNFEPVPDETAKTAPTKRGVYR